MSETTQDTLERLVDETSLAFVLGQLAAVCDGKADHLRASWQDRQSALLWERFARQLDSEASQAHLAKV
jgi:hypothetical protein